MVYSIATKQRCNLHWAVRMRELFIELMQEYCSFTIDLILFLFEEYSE